MSERGRIAGEDAAQELQETCGSRHGQGAVWAADAEVDRPIDSPRRILLKRVSRDIARVKTVMGETKRRLVTVGLMVAAPERQVEYKRWANGAALKK